MSDNPRDDLFKSLMDKHNTSDPTASATAFHEHVVIAVSNPTGEEDSHGVGVLLLAVPLLPDAAREFAKAVLHNADLVDRATRVQH